MSIPFLGEWADPFLSDPNFNKQTEKDSNNFIERGISQGIENGFDSIWNKIIHKGELKLDNFAVNLPQVASVTLIAYLVYLGYRSFIKRDIPDFANVYTSIMVYTIFRLFWKVILHI